jgi:hypothetical protein
MKLNLELSNNTRLRIGVWSILAILIFYIVLLQSERLDEANADYSQANTRLEKSQRLLEQKDWVSLLEAENQNLDSLKGYIWQAETSGLAQASLQGALRNMINGLELKNSRFKPGVVQAVEGMEGVWQVQMQLDARYNLGAELNLLYKIAQNPEKILVDRLYLNTNNSRIILITSAYFTGFSGGGS